jgi:hypothetical protein
MIKWRKAHSGLVESREGKRNFARSALLKWRFTLDFKAKERTGDAD